MPAKVNDFDNGAQGTIADDALGTAANGFYKGWLMTIPTTEGTKTEGLADPQHIVAIALLFMLVGRIELCVLQLQTRLVLTIEVKGLAGIEIDADGIELALESDTMVVLDIIGIGCIAACGDSIDIVVLLMLFQLLVLGIGEHHLCIDASRVGPWLTIAGKRNLVALLLLAFQVGQETQLIEGTVLVEIIQLTGNLCSATGDQCRAHIHGIAVELHDNWLVASWRRQRIADTHLDGLLSHHGQGRQCIQ